MYAYANHLLYICICIGEKCAVPGGGVWYSEVPHCVLIQNNTLQISRAVYVIYPCVLLSLYQFLLSV